ncbi:hypothetical protein IPJ72_06600 [Candidatus Peregrinibacteria bacterium]|nr:MAG: hypothetical protein IPJ72_06600 [Candidatus Peregrinibacteria bacterium]
MLNFPNVDGFTAKVAQKKAELLNAQSYSEEDKAIIESIFSRDPQRYLNGLLDELKHDQNKLKKLIKAVLTKKPRDIEEMYLRLVCEWLDPYLSE